MNLLSAPDIQETDSLASTLIRSHGVDTAAEVIAELRAGWEQEKVLAAVRQRNIKAASDRLDNCAIEGVGQCTMRIDPIAYHYWGARKGYACWNDPEFCRDFLRDNPAARVKYTPRKTTVTRL